MKIEEGTVVRGTDFKKTIPALRKELRRLSPELAKKVEMPGGWLGKTDYEDYEEDLIGALDDLAPKGMYFGSRQGDESNLGFWRFDPESV